MKKIICSLLIVICTHIHAQTIRSLKSVLAEVEKNYPSIKAKQANEKAASYYVNAAKKDYLPDLIVGDQYTYSTNNGLEGSYYGNEGTTISTSGGVREDNIYQGVFGSFTTLMVDWRLFNFGKVKQSVRFAESQQQLAKDDYANEVFKQKIIAIDAYLHLSLLEKLLTVQQKNLDRAIAFQQYAISRANAGLLPGADSSYANAEVAKARLALLQSQREIEQQKIILSQLTGLKEASINVDTTLFFEQVPVLQTDTLSIKSHPYIQYARQQLDVAQQNSEVVKKSVLPTINLLGIGWARGSGIDRNTNEYKSELSDGIPYQTYNYMAGVAVKWNIMSLAKNKQEYKAAQQKVETSKYNLNEEQLALQSQLQNAQLQYNLALEQTKVAPVQYQSAYDAYQQSNARYKAGLATLTELVQALYALNRADVDKAVANDNVWRALLQNAAATGDLQIFLNQLP